MFLTHNALTYGDVLFKKNTMNIDKYDTQSYDLEAMRLHTRVLLIPNHVLVNHDYIYTNMIHSYTRSYEITYTSPAIPNHVLVNHDYIYTNMIHSYELEAMRLHTRVLLYQTMTL